MDPVVDALGAMFESRRIHNVTTTALSLPYRGPGRRARFHCTCDVDGVREEAFLDASRFVLRGDDSEGRPLLFVHPEVAFYSSILPTQLPPGITAARCYGRHVEGELLTLYFEARPLVVEGRWTNHHYALVARALGRLNGRFNLQSWVAPSWLRHHLLSTVPRDTSFQGLAQSDAGETAMPLLAKVLSNVDRYRSTIESLPSCLCHGNAFRLHVDVGHGEVVMSDWDSVSVNGVGMDASALVGANHFFGEEDESALDAVEHVVLDEYEAGLRDEGWRLPRSTMVAGYVAASGLRLLRRAALISDLLVRSQELAVPYSAHTTSLRDLGDRLAATLRLHLRRLESTPDILDRGTLDIACRS